MHCLTCKSSLAYTCYVRVVERNPKTHHTKQIYKPAGILCLDCSSFQLGLDTLAIGKIRHRRERQSGSSSDSSDTTQ